MPINHLINRLGPGMMQEGVMLEIQREFNDLHARVEAMETSMELLRSRIKIPGDDFFVGTSYPYPPEPNGTDAQRSAIDKFREAFGRKVTESLPQYTPPPQEQKDEAHPATQTSFVLKI